ncbi:PREDICTED: MAG2-interacting protein 2 isoform X1 [Lupinus angustifolius]|uniref:MAG2-interacting protein 2 isoform X1 n=1 Tax=Lupinus angustifolius TaxID=3871 RepID=UPI00092F2B27|nr:PREDICTED: MAG2-interacting protein 2 isoform X1 [Lupinus angustifolius]
MGEVPLYETRRHASSTPHHSSNLNYPQHLIPLQHQPNQAATGTFLSSLSIPGVSRLKEKWSEYNQPKRLKRLASLFVSHTAKHVAVAVENQITILSKEDDYQEPCGVFTNCSPSTFSVGAWSEDDDILGVADDSDTLYFIKFNGEVVTKITKKQLKFSSLIVGLFSDNNLDRQKSYSCRFTIITSDGSLQQIELDYGQSGSTFPKCISNHKSSLCNNIFYSDWHHELNLFVAVHKNSGSCHLSVWHNNSSTELEQLSSLQLEGLYSKPKGYKGQLTHPKVLISPQGTFVSTLDLTGRLNIFKLDKKGFTLSWFVLGDRNDSPMSDNLSNGGRKYFVDCMDFTWWCDHILVIVDRNGVVMLIDILNGSKLQEEDPAFFLPVLERARNYKGCLFLLASPSSLEGYNNTSDFGTTDDFDKKEWVTEDRFNQFHFSRLLWCLISFAEKSIPEMYGILISKKRYQAASDFADSHGLDKDEVLKSQWLNSSQGISEVNMFLSNIRDRDFVLSECVDRIGPTEDAVKALLAYGLLITDHHRFSEVDDDNSSQVWDVRLTRLQILQFRDRLETYLGINMGRFSVQEYSKFRVMPINEAAVALAASGKIGALNLLFKRHPYSLSPFMLDILAAIPETVPVQTYGQLLPGRSPPSGVAVRHDDWVECKKMAHYINVSVKNLDIQIQAKTEPLVNYSHGYFWPSVDELSNWYKDRAKAMDDFSGQLDNSFSLLEFALRKGISELQQFHQDVLYLYQIIYSDAYDGEISFHMSLSNWGELSDYDKFKFMLKGVKEEDVTERLHNRAIPFMREKFHRVSLVEDVIFYDSVNQNMEESFLVRWLKETASENKLDICLVVIEEGCRNFQSDIYFITEVEAVDCALQCIYLSTVTDRWNIMAAILSKLPKLHDGAIEVENLERRLRVSEGHIEAGRLLALYQVPKPLNFFLGAQSDEKGVKQMIRLILSKFIRRQPSRSDSEWASLWRDMQYLREKAFPFLDLEYILIEFCRGLLKAGKFSLARNYLKGTSSVALASEKAENLVIQAAREYFFSASSLSCSEIWKAKECLNLYPSSGNVKKEADIIDALTVKLPNLGVNILPMQFRQIKDPMEIVKMAIISQAGAYFHVDEIIEVARLLGLRSADDISAVEEAIAREAAVSGDLQLAFDLCLVLARKGHGSVWDLCAAIARGPALENMDVYSRKQLLGFALSHCDEESIGELLHAWKDLDMQGQCETLMMSTGTNSSNFSAQGSSVNSLPGQSMQNMLDRNASTDNQDVHLEKTRDMLSIVAKTLAVGDRTDWAACLTENGKVLSFAALQLPWLLELSRKGEHDMKHSTGNKYLNTRTQAVVTILSWLARNEFAPRDNLIASLAQSIMEQPVTEEGDIMGCSYLLNLVDAFSGVEVIEEQLKIRKDYHEICSIMNVGLAYSLAHNSGIGADPAQRKELLQKRFKEKHASSSSDEIDKLGKVQSSFWREWKLKLEEQKRLTEHSRALEKIIPGVETERFLSGDSIYIKNVVISLIESIEFEKKHILKDILKLADTYDLSYTEVLLRYLGAVLVSDVWTNDDITVEIEGYKGEIIGNSARTTEIISTIVYPAIDGCNKLRLAYVYGLLSECYLQLENTKDLSPIIQSDHANTNIRFTHYYKVIEEECKNVSFINNLNFKNIAGLHGLNFECFQDEVYACIEESNLSALSKMVQALGNIYGDSLPEGFLSWQDVYKYYIQNSLRALVTKASIDSSIRTPEYLQGFISNLEQSYGLCRMYIKLLAQADALGIMKHYFTVIMPLYSSYGSLPDNSTWQDCLIILLNFWTRLTDDMKEIALQENSGETISFNPECLMSCLKVFMKLVMEDIISPSQGWGSIYGYVNFGLSGDSAVEIYNFCKAMIFSGCGFGAVAEVFSAASSEAGLASDCSMGSHNLPDFYLGILEAVLKELVTGSHENQNLYHILSSLSKLEGDLEVMQCVRQVIWDRMVQFSDNLQLPSSIRVYVLELMQFISGKSIKGFSTEIEANVQQWEEWNELLYANRMSERDVNQQLRDDHKDSSSRFTSTLVALKSSQLAASISPSIEITPDDLVNADMAVSCFLRLCGESSTDLHFDALLAILEEWDGLFSTKKDGETTAKPSDGENVWNSDDWDEGWESLEEVDNLEKEKKDDSVSVHPLHVCWTEIFRKLINQSRFNDVLRQIDQSSLKPNVLLLDEDDAQSLNQIALGINCFLALKMTLLLPYKTLQLQCLGAVEDNLKQDIPETRSTDNELLILILSSGIITSIITDSTFGTTFSYICYLIGNFSHQCQQALVPGTGINKSEDEENQLLLFRRILFPNFLSEFVKADQHVLAGFLVTKFMHTNEALSLINIAETSLNRYLEMQLHMLQVNEFPVDKTCKTLKNTVSSLRGKLSNLVQSTLSLLSATVR